MPKDIYIARSYIAKDIGAGDNIGSLYCEISLPLTESVVVTVKGGHVGYSNFYTFFIKK